MLSNRYGGDNMNEQIAIIKKNQIDIIAATPGRVLDCIKQGKLTLS